MFAVADRLPQLDVAGGGCCPPPAARPNGMCMPSEFGGMPSADDGGVRCCGVDDAGGAVGCGCELQRSCAPGWALGIVSAAACATARR